MVTVLILTSYVPPANDPDNAVKLISVVLITLFTLSHSIYTCDGSTSNPAEPVVITRLTSDVGLLAKLISNCTVRPSSILTLFNNVVVIAAVS